METADIQVVTYPNERCCRDLEESEIAELELGSYPAIEALAFAVIAVRRWAKEQYENRPVEAHPNLPNLKATDLGGN